MVPAVEGTVVVYPCIKVECEVTVPADTSLGNIVGTFPEAFKLEETRIRGVVGLVHHTVIRWFGGMDRIGIRIALHIDQSGDIQTFSDEIQLLDSTQGSIYCRIVAFLLRAHHLGVCIDLQPVGSLD